MTPPARPRRILDPTLGAKLVVTTGLGLVLFNHGELLYRLPVQRLPRPPQDWWFLAALVGFLLPQFYWAGCRAVGFVPVAVTVAYGCGIAARATGSIPDGLLAVTIVAYAVAFGSMFRHYARNLPRRLVKDEPNEPISVVPTADIRLQGLLVLVLAYLAILWYGVPSKPTPYWWWQTITWGFLVSGGFVVAFAWWRFFRPFFELCVEPVLWLGYAVRGAGPGVAANPLPGVKAFPYHGPLLVVANHACWWDPLFLAKVLPRPVTPVMTAKFYDRWFLRPLMAYTFQVIRVPEAAVRREAPEIHDAIAALDAGKCVIIFPEGFLRRKEEQPLRRFGRGVWEILKARPDTPVLACWIEGNWGSWTSYYNGPPTKNKKREFRRPIGVGVSAPAAVEPAVLANHLRTRVALMNRVLAARVYLGLPALPPVELPVKGEAEDGEPPA
jgi:1-acyl-sn-glycerol-3-phosphate acyltransferase